MNNKISKKAGFAAIIGNPNSGKSTLMNKILGQEISIVTPKPQTTRNKILGIYSAESIQIIFLDTPGILKPGYKLQQFMKKEIESSLLDSDVILLVLDTNKYDEIEVSKLLDGYKDELSKHKVLCVLNKIDLLNKENVLQIIDSVSKLYNFKEIIPLSAKTGYNVDELLKTIEKYIPENDFYYDAEAITSSPEKFFVSEIIRQNILTLYQEEIPYSVFVEIEEFSEKKNRKDFIRANIIVGKDSQKGIIIGQGGKKLKSLGERARKQIEIFLEREVYVELFVKVKQNWRNDEDFLKRKFKQQSTIAN